MNLYNIFTPEEQETTAMKLEITTAGAVNVTKKKLKIDKKIFYKSRDDVQCHFKIMHMPLVNITDTRVMKYRGKYPRGLVGKNLNMKPTKLAPSRR